MNGIDVSRYQGMANWPQVKTAGKSFVLVRAGYGNVATQKDSMFDANVKGALAQGLHVGAYWFSYAVSEDDARKEADVFNQILSPYRGKLDFPVAYDFEGASVTYYQKVKGAAPTISQSDAFAREFLDRLKSFGWFVNLYTNIDFIRTGRFSAATRAAYDVWLADYCGGPDYTCTIQQTGDKGSVPGITGSVDLDVSFKDYPTIIRAGGYNGFAKQPTTAVQIDTTMDVEKPAGSVYTFRTAAGQTPTVTVGTEGVVQLMHCRREMDADFWHLFFTGKSGAEAGIYTAAPGEQPMKRFKARVA